MLSSSTSTEPEPCESSASLREKVAGTCLVTTVVVYGIYFAHVLRLLVGGRFHAGNLLLAMMLAGLLQSVLALGVIPLTWRNRHERKDERDAALELRACRNAYWILAVVGYLVVLAAPVWAVSGPTAGQDFWFAPLALSQVAFLGFVIAETVRFATLTHGYRRGV